MRQEFEEQFFTLDNGTQLRYFESRGSASQTDMILVHGLGNNAQVWFKLMRLLAPDYRCLAIDLPEHGASRLAEGQPLDFACFSDTVLAFAHAKNIQSAVLVGHSMGGQVSILTALKQPAWLRSCVLLAPAGFEVFTEKEKNWLNAIYAVWMIKKLSPERMAAQTRENFHVFPEDFSFFVDELMAIRSDEQAFLAYCNTLSASMSGLLQAPVFSQLADIKCPCSVFFGLNDKVIPNSILHPGMTPQQVAEAGSQQIAQAALHLLSECGHMLQWEAAERIAEGIRLDGH